MATNSGNLYLLSSTPALSLASNPYETLPQPHGRVREWIMIGVRMDKWLWAARFFKTRALAADACELGRIQSNGQRAKASREVRVGDLLQVRNEAGDFQIEVLLTSESRGPAEIARTLYRETEESRALRLKVAEERKEMLASGALQETKPSKHDRYERSRLRGKVHRF